MLKKYHHLITVLISLLELSYSQRSIGDLCTLETSGHPGVCKLFNDCPQAREDLRKHIRPQTCGFKKTEPIVCCPEIPEIPEIPEKQVGEISKQKCREYAAHVFVRRESPLIGGETTIRNECGHKVVKLIVGGTAAGRKEFPHMAAIGFEPNPGVVHWYCGGAIISEKYILTAAHCLNHRTWGDAKWILMGVSELNSTSSYRQVIKVADRIAYPEYDSISHYHDIALIRLEKTAKMNPYARPACLNLKQEIAAETAIATGFGQTSWGGTGSNNLLKVTIDLFDHDFCNSSYKNQISERLKYGIMRDTQLCAGSVRDEKDTCQGDSGGPLQIYHIGDDIKCMYDIVGVTSFGKACSGSPGVYVRVSHYIKWIEDTVWSK